MERGVYCYEENTFEVTEEMKAGFDNQGYLLLRGVLDTEEMGKLEKALNSDGIQKGAYRLEDSAGSAFFMTHWNKPGNDVTGMVARSEKIAGIVEKLLGGEVYHYHSKLSMKEPHVGSYEWHQDYGYWYNYGLLYPEAMTVFIPLDRSNTANGCLEILTGSNKCGLIQHSSLGSELAADAKRVELIAEKCPLQYVQLDPGDVFYCHCNLLHRFPVSRSPGRKWTMVCCYNRASNDPVVPQHCSNYTPLNKVPNASIRSCGNLTDMSAKDFWKPPVIQRSISKDKGRRSSKTSN